MRGSILVLGLLRRRCNRRRGNRAITANEAEHAAKQFAITLKITLRPAINTKSITNAGKFQAMEPDRSVSI